MPAEKFTWDDMPAEQVTDTFSRKMVVSKNEKFAGWNSSRGERSRNTATKTSKSPMFSRAASVSSWTGRRSRWGRERSF